MVDRMFNQFIQLHSFQILLLAALEVAVIGHCMSSKAFLYHNSESNFAHFDPAFKYIPTKLPHTFLISKY